MSPNVTDQPTAGNVTPAPPIDRGFYALDRTALRAAFRSLGPTLAGVLIALASEVRHDGERLTVPTGNASDIAEIIGTTPKATRQYLADLERAGAIEWTRATNQHTGRLVLCVDLERPLERPKRRRPRGEAASTGATSSASPAEVGVPESVTPTVDNAPPAEVGVPVGVPKSGTPNKVIPISITSNPPLPPKTAQHGTTSPPTSRVGEESRDEAEHITAEVIEAAAATVCKDRESTRGVAGPKARRKVRDGIIAAGLDRKALEWMNAGCSPQHIAVAIAERYRASEGEHANANAVPADLTELLEERRSAAARACLHCDDYGWITTKEYHPNGTVTPYSALCSCQSLEVSTGVSS